MQTPNDQESIALRRGHDDADRVRLQRAVEASQDAVICWDVDGTITHWNPAAEALYGYAAAEAVGRSVLMLVPEDHLAAWHERFDQIRAGPGVSEFETVRVAKNGARIDVSLTVSPIRDAAGDTVALITTARDIRERRRREEELHAVLREMDHRTKNLLQILTAVVHLTRAETVDQLKRELAGRIAALARAHAQLTERQWQGAELKSLLEDGLKPFAAPRLELSGPRVTVSSEAAYFLALVLHELATNATKYGALSAPSGRVRLGWSLGLDGLALGWIEEDGPPVTKPERRGVGLASIEGHVVNQLGGRLGFEWAATGLRCEIVIPPHHVVAAE